MTNPNEYTSNECTCFISALRASEQLHQILVKIYTHRLDQILAYTRHAIKVVHQYSTCEVCADSSRFPVYTILLRQVTECYQALLQRCDSGPGGLTTIKLQVGSFRVDAPIDTTVRTIVCSELQRTADAASKLDSALEMDGVKNARETWGNATCAYQSSLMEALKSDIAKMRNESHETTGEDCITAS